MAIFLAVALIAPVSAQEAPTDPGVRSLTPDEEATLSENAESFQFQSEVSRLMKLIINSLYKTRDIFLRELISNASDALDKIRFISLTDKSAMSANTNLNISILADAQNKVLVITDTGIGMTRKQLQDNLGTIAKSGTSEFLAAFEDDKADMNLIGQFGVGFYSVFLVAEKVTVASKSNDDPDQWIWESAAVADFKIAKDPRGNTLGRGTQITLHIKDDATEYLQEAKLKSLVGKYSEFIQFPIYQSASYEETVPVPDDDELDTDKDEADKVDAEAEIEDFFDEEKEKKPKAVTVTRQKWDLMNTQKPIWTREPKEVEETEYSDFYKTFFKDTEDPTSHLHFKAEGDVEFRSIIFIPRRAPAEMYARIAETVSSVKLFVKRVFITDELVDFLPRYLHFLKVVVDAEDVPLNVSRETLQQHRTLRLIQKRIVKKALELLAALTENAEKYRNFMKQFGSMLKLGAIEDKKNQDRISKLLRFESSKSNFTSLQEYVDGMKEGQTNIFFLAGIDDKELKASPFAERLIARGYEVLYFSEPIDEIMVQHMPTFSGKTFQNIAKEGLKFGDESESETEETEALNERFKPLADFVLGVLKEDIEKVVVSNRLTTSPCALVANSIGWTGNMEKIMNAQQVKSGDDAMRMIVSTQKKIMEINPKHPLIEGLLTKVSNETPGEEMTELINVLYDTTVIRSGFNLKDTPSYASRVEKILRANLGVDLEAQPVIVEEPAKDRQTEAEMPDEPEKKETVVPLPVDIDDDDDEDLLAGDIRGGVRGGEQKVFDMGGKSIDDLFDDLMDDDDTPRKDEL